MSFKITDISSEQKLQLSNIDSRDLNKRFGQNGDFLELHIHTLNDELLSSFRVNSSDFKVTNKDKDGLSNEINLNFINALNSAGFKVGKYKLKLNVLRPKIFGLTSDYLSIKEISTSRKELRVISTKIANKSFDKGIKNYIAERDSAPYFKDFILRFNGGEALGINLLLNDLIAKHEALIKLYNPLPQSISIHDSFTIVEEIIDPLLIEVDLTQNLDNLIINDGVFLQPNFNIDTRTNSSIPSNYKDFNNILEHSFTSSYNQLLNQLENRDVPEISYDYIRPISSSTENIDTPSHFENFVHFGSATERLHNFKYKVSLIELYDSQLDNIQLIPGNASASSFTLTNTKVISDKKQNILKNLDGYERFLYYTEGSNILTWPKSTTTYPYTLYPITSSQVESWLGAEGYGESVAGGQLHSASVYDNTNPYNLEQLIPAHIKENGENNFYLSFVNMIGQHFDHIWTHIKHITEVNDTHHTRGISKDLVWYQLKALGIDAFDQFENSNLIEYILGQGSSGSLFYDTPTSQSMVTASNAGSVAKQDITKEVWKRLYHNAPYLLKTKGTERGIRALMACYGLPSTMLNVKEYGGSTPTSGLILKDVDLADYYKTFTYQKGSLALKTTAAVSTNNYMARFPWEDNDIAARSSKSVELRIKPIKGNEGIALSLGDTTAHAAGLQLTLDKYTGNDISSSGDASTYGRINLEQNGTVQASTSYFPLYNGYFWNLHLMGTGTDVFFGAYQTNHLKNTFKFTGTWGLNTYANNFGLNSAAGSTYVYAGTNGYNGSIQGLKCHWGEKLTDATLTKHSLEPFMYSGNFPSSSFNNVIIRLPLGSNDKESLENHAPDTTLKHTNTTAASNVTTTWEEIVEDHYLPTPDTVGRSMSSEKVRIDTGTVNDDILSPFSKAETSTLDKQPQDYSDLGIYFSPTTEINEDILYTLGSFRLDDYIGSPLPSAQTSSNYSDLSTIKDYYFKKVKKRYNYWDYIKLIQHVDHTLFKIIEQWVPWKANTKTGLLIEPHYLERTKFPRQLPQRSDGQTMTPGLHGAIEAQITGEFDNELYSLVDSSVVTTNNLSTTVDSDGHKIEQGTNATINIFDDYTNPFLRDANYPNNHSSQAPIIPYITTQPEGYKTHNSNVLLGMATKGKISSRYYRTLRNGKETDF